MKSRLKVKNLDLSDKVVTATRKKVSVNTSDEMHVPKFTEEQVTPTVDVNVTSEVEFDTYISWVISSTGGCPFIDISPTAEEVTFESFGSYGNFSIPFGNPLPSSWPSGPTITSPEGYDVTYEKGYEGTFTFDSSLTGDWTIVGDLIIDVQEVAGTNIGNTFTLYLGVGDRTTNFVGLLLYGVTGRMGWGVDIYMCKVTEGSETLTHLITITDLGQKTATLTISKVGTLYGVTVSGDFSGSDSMAFTEEQDIFVGSYGQSNEYSVLDGILRWNSVHKI